MLKPKNKLVVLFTIIFGTIYSTKIFAQTDISIAFHTPLEHHLSQNVFLFKQELEKTSNGLFYVTINDYESYLKSISEKEDLKSDQKYFMEKDIIEAVQKNKVKVGMISLARLAQSIPLADIFNQPFLFDSERRAAETSEKGSVVRTLIEKSLKELGLTALWWQPYGSIVLVSNGSSVNNPEQMKDKKVRVFSETLADFVLASGGTPLAIPNSYEYFSYKHRKVDIGMTTIADVKTKKLWEVMDTISLTNSANLQFLMIANNGWWNSLSPNLRKRISDAAEVAEEKSVESLKNIESTSFKKAIENGMKIVLLSTDDKDYWRELSIPIYKRFLERTGESGQLAFDSVNSF